MERGQLGPKVLLCQSFTESLDEGQLSAGPSDSFIALNNMNREKQKPSTEMDSAWALEILNILGSAVEPKRGSSHPISMQSR